MDKFSGIPSEFGLQQFDNLNHFLAQLLLLNQHQNSTNTLKLKEPEKAIDMAGSSYTTTTTMDGAIFSNPLIAISNGQSSTHQPSMSLNFNLPTLLPEPQIQPIVTEASSSITGNGIDSVFMEQFNLFNALIKGNAAAGSPNATSQLNMNSILSTNTSRAPEWMPNVTTVSSSNVQTAKNTMASVGMHAEKQSSPRPKIMGISGAGGLSRNPTKCVVCARMSLYNYYGVKCCESCKQFFRRIIVKQTEFHCSHNRNCGLQGVEKCRGCRLDRCLVVGMNPTLITGAKAEFRDQFLAKIEQRRAFLLEKERTNPTLKNL